MAAANPLTSVSYKSFRPEAGAGSASTIRVEPISKSPEEDDKASELDEAEEVLGVELQRTSSRRRHWIQAKKRSTSQRL